ncbi:sushi domain-containing protein 6 isoform X2 [Syngnathoides biaculeatus]|uniref:sushi domain-containing protein 6 isoform X2 n=1 Tax=Syngnathoides biaculeatus TaxID=300417 RepID=UPI002ADD4EE3|nr:sushi domain-containing protein 6 isoform X2 [Syngnathoides biaculeatus]
MSALPSFPWPRRCIIITLVILLTSLPRLFAGRLSNCTHPLVPEHGGFRCEPSPCRGFPHKSSVRLFCEDGYRAAKSAVSWCRDGAWKPPIPACVRVRGGARINAKSGADFSMPNMATTAVGVSIFLLTTTACLVVKSRLCSCQSHGRRSSDQLDLMSEGLHVSLPSYEEAVYGSWGQPLPPCRSPPPGPVQLLLAREPPDDRPRPETGPPPYEEAQSRRNDSRRIAVSQSDDKAV